MSNPDTTRIFNYPEVTTPASDAKILLDSQTVGSKCIDANLFRCDLIDKTITQRGTFEASEDDADGFKKVVVDIPYTDVHVASGPIATFEGEDLPLKSLTASIVPVQDLHGYDSPWPAGGGKNKWEFDSSLSGNGNVLSGKVFTYQIPSDTYTLSCKGTFASGGAMAFRFVYTDDTTKDVTLGYNVQSGTYYVSAVFEKAVKRLSYVYSNNANNNINSIQLEQGESATAYAPYSNICPISGWTEEVITRTGVNVWDEEWELGYYDADGLPQPSLGNIRNKEPIMVKGLPSVYIKSATQYGLRIRGYDINKSVNYDFGYVNNQAISIPSNVVYITYYTNAADNVTTYNNDISINYPSTDTEYHAYSGTTTTIPFTDSQGQSVEVFGGSVDVVNGVVTPCPYYASYNGEQLTGEWISDRDVYSPNTTPTIGAQVVNIGATDTPFYTQPTSIKSLDGVNNVFASTGDVDVEYQTVWVRPTE